MPAPHPRMHGITHVPGGPDPIPIATVPGGDYPSLVFAISGLRGYWRLGETAAPLHDTSGYDTAHPADMTLHANGVPMSLHQTGALAAGKDDGAVTQNYAGTTTSSNTDADWLEGAISSGDHRFSFDPTDAMSVAAWVRPAASGNTWVGGVVAAFQAGIVGSPNYDGGWALQLNWPSLTPTFWRGDQAGFQQATAAALTAGVWSHLAATYDGATIRLYVNGALAASAVSAAALPATGLITVGNMTPEHGAPGSGDVYRGRFYGGLDEAAVWAGVIDPAQMAALAGASGGGGFAPAGSVPVSDGAGHISWQQPTVDATVNGHEPVAAETPLPSPTPPPPPDTDPVDLLMIDQPFTYGGGTFTVQPERWTTIPFTSPLMERMSDKTGVSAWAEIDITDPDAGGWLHHDVPHMIEIPHDIPFLAEAMAQVCLRIDYPRVQGTSSHRALRILETTHQKTLLLVQSELADGCCAEGGMTDVFRGPGITVFASGDTGSTGTHNDIFFAPNFGLAFYPVGYDWLPYVDGVQSLREGMRLVAQCWHDATVPLTFSCVPGATYKPHFVLNADCDPAWGPPWSTWL